MYGWIDFNNNGRFETSERAKIVVPNDAKTVKLNFGTFQATNLGDNAKVYMRLRLVQAEKGVILEEVTEAPNGGTLVDELAIADGLKTGEYGIVTLGEVEDYQLSAVRDYGDAPLSYENGSPASHINTLEPELALGTTVDFELAPASVAVGANNNDTNGDGQDEDGIITPHVITIGVPHSITLPIKTKVEGTKYLYGWIDFNGDGIFSQNEGATASGEIGLLGTNSLKLTWPKTVIPTSVPTSGKVYARFRLSKDPLINTNNSNPTAIDTRSFGLSSSIGEVEDYQFIVSNDYDYGDLPVSYETNRLGEILPARQAPSNILRLGASVATESSPNSVSPGADNNGANGEGADKDAMNIIPIYKGTNYYSRVSVMNASTPFVGSSRKLYGWIDFNNDGRFQASEVAETFVSSSENQQKVTLKWDKDLTNTIPAGVKNVYMRLRISDTTLTDFTDLVGGDIVDERSIGDGIANTGYDAVSIGEIEDYFIPVGDFYDYGDLPDSYDTNLSGTVVPARQVASEALFLGDLIPDVESTKYTSNNALGDNINGINDEDGIRIVTPMVNSSSVSYAMQAKVTNFTGVAKTLYAWMDLNGDGRFEAAEAKTIQIPHGSDGLIVHLDWDIRNLIVGNRKEIPLRLRISDISLSDGTMNPQNYQSIADGNSQDYTTAGIGEIEDYMIPIGDYYDYGDAPASFDLNAANISVPARHLIGAIMSIGDSVSGELGPKNIDNDDDDGVKVLPTLVTSTSYAINVDVVNNTEVYEGALLHGWIDFDGNGRFTADEFTSTRIPKGSGKTTVELKWNLTAYSGTSDKTYMRLRLTDRPLVDNPDTPMVDERAIGNGSIEGQTNLYPGYGEIEDYIIPVDLAAASAPAPEVCNMSDDRLGLLSPITALTLGTIIRDAKGDWWVFGHQAHPKSGGAWSEMAQLIPLKVEAGKNYFDMKGRVLMVTGFSHVYSILTTAGLYQYGGDGMLQFESIKQVPLPPGVGPADVKMMDGGKDSGLNFISTGLLTKSGEVWINRIDGSDIVFGTKYTEGWKQVMLDENTPLTGMKDLRIAGHSAIATDGNNFYTWGKEIYLGDGEAAISKDYATKMVTPQGITLPIKQQELSKGAGIGENGFNLYTGTSVSYYLRDSAGKVFVLGNNSRGQLGVGNRKDALNWMELKEMNERPTATTPQNDVTVPIKKVIWISASSSDGLRPNFSFITEDYRNYTTGANVNISETPGLGFRTSGGAPFATNYDMPTAITTDGGRRMLDGKMLYVSAGGYFSIIVKEGSDRFGFVGKTSHGNDGCDGCTNSPLEYSFAGFSSGPLCGTTAFDYGDLDNRYNQGDAARHEIKFGQDENPLKLGSKAADSDDGPQFKVTGSGNDALGDDSDEQGDDEDAFTDTLPVKTKGQPYTLNVPFTNNTGADAYLYGFIDWNSNGVFEPKEAVVQKVSASSTAQTVSLTWTGDTRVNCENGDTVRSFVRLRLTTDQLTDDIKTPYDERSFLGASDGEVEDYYVDWLPDCVTYCVKPPQSGNPVLGSKVGISVMKTQKLDWEKVPNAWLSLESKTKGFVISRVENEGVIANPMEGMLIYDKVDNCVKLFNGTEWKCLERDCND